MLPVTPLESLRSRWPLDPEVAFLNHGSFGACPHAVTEARRQLLDELEREPVDFFVRRYEERLDAARGSLARFLHADPDDLVPVVNATYGVGAVLRSLSFEPGDELLTTNHAYNACRNVLDFVTERAGARVVTAEIPFPLHDSEQVVDVVLDRATPKTRLALLDHVTSPTGLVLPLERLLRELSSRGVEVLVDGAHGPGMVPLDLTALGDAGASYYTGNGHKWLCGPKSAGFLWVRRDRQEHLRPLTISHGANRPRPRRSRFHDEFDWPGTTDPTPFFCLPGAVDFLASLVPSGWDEIRARNRRLVLRGRKILCEALGVEPPCPEDMIGFLAAIPLPDGSPEPPTSALYSDPVQNALRREYGIEVPIVPWPKPPKRLVRISAHLYNCEQEYRRLARVLPSLVSTH